jgi:hypothetical protein
MHACCLCRQIAQHDAINFLDIWCAHKLNFPSHVNSMFCIGRDNCKKKLVSQPLSTASPMICKPTTGSKPQVKWPVAPESKLGPAQWNGDGGLRGKRWHNLSSPIIITLIDKRNACNLSLGFCLHQCTMSELELNETGIAKLGTQLKWSGMD